MLSEEKRAKELHAQLTKLFPGAPKKVFQKPSKPKTLDFLYKHKPRIVPKKPVKSLKSPFKLNYEALKPKPILADAVSINAMKSAQEAAKSAAELSQMASEMHKRATNAESVSKSAAHSASKSTAIVESLVKEVSSLKKDSLTPLTRNEIEEMILAQANKPVEEMQTPEVTLALVKEIVRLMHQLPESERLDVSGIRNFQSFVYKGTKYEVAEMMHGGGSSGSSGNVYYTPTRTVNAVNTTFGVTAQPTSVIADGITYFENSGYTYAALVITMDIAPSQFIRYTL